MRGLSIWLAATALLLLALGMALAAFVRSVRRSILAGMPRQQQLAFVYRLRDLVFADPHRYMTMLLSEDRHWFVRTLFQECKAFAPRLPAGGSPVEAMTVTPMQLRDGRALAVVKMPEPVSQNETLFIGIILPRDETLARDVPRAKNLVRFFHLNRWGGQSRSTDLCGWTIKKQHRTYNVGATPTEQGFAEAIQKKLIELRQ